MRGHGDSKVDDEDDLSADTLAKWVESKKILFSKYVLEMVMQIFLLLTLKTNIFKILSSKTSRINS